MGVRVCACVHETERERNWTPVCIREHKTKGIYFMVLMFWSFYKTEFCWVLPYSSSNCNLSKIIR